MANLKRNQLTTLKVKHAKPGVHTDGAGLTLRVKPSGGRSWVLRFTVDGKVREIGLGGYPSVGLKDARQLAQELRAVAQRGLDPAAYLKAIRKTEQPADWTDTPTFAQAAERVIKFREPSWSSTRHATQWRESLRIHALPVIGDRPVDEIETKDVLAVLEPIWHTKAETASRVRQRLSVIFDYCVGVGWRQDANPCMTLGAMLPRRPRTRRHHPALPYTEVSDALAAFPVAPGHPNCADALTFLVLTAARAGEVRHATWDEIDLDSRVWTVPSEHMKMRKEHRVPLSTGAVEVLQRTAKRTGRKGLVYPSNRKAEQPFSNMAFEMLLRRAGYSHVTVHGFRASFRTWTLEQTDAPWAVAEAALAHTLGGQEVMAYVRGDQFERRRRLMEEWSDYVGAVPELQRISA